MGKNTFTPEKVRELAIELYQCSMTPQNNERLITEWLEQNQPTPQVVGLSDEQIYQAARRVCELGFDVGRNSINEISLIIAAYLEAETFTQSSPKVVGLSNEQVISFYEKFKDSVIPKCEDFVVEFNEWQKNQTFTQREPVIVGFNDEQVESLTDYIGCSADTITKVRNKIVGWLKTQTFTQPDDYEEKYLELYDDYQSLIVDKMLVEKELEQLKSQPDWDNLENDVVSIQNGYITYDTDNCTQWFEVGDMIYRPKTKTFTQSEVVVGLSDEQVGELAEVVAGVDNIARLENRIRGWLMTQKFAQLDLSNSQLIQTVLDMHNYQGLKDELEQLKSQQFTQNSEQALIDIKRMIRGSMIQARFGIFDKILDVIESVIKPTPKVKVGQVWRRASEGEGGDDYEVTEVTTLEGKFKIGDEWHEDVVMITYENAAQDVYRRILSDFLAKFEQVQP